MAISSINNVQEPPAFKGSWDKTYNGMPYYKTNSGVKAGAIMSVPAAIFWLSQRNIPTTEKEIRDNINKFKDAFFIGFKKSAGEENVSEYAKIFEEGVNDSLKELKPVLERNKKIKAMAIPCAALAAGLTLGCGFLVDYLRNQKAKETADLVRSVGTKNAVLQNDNVSISNKGRAYFDSNIGTKYGPLLGALCGLAHAAMCRYAKPGKFISNAILYGIGGFIMGKIADSNTNKDAVKNA